MGKYSQVRIEKQTKEKAREAWRVRLGSGRAIGRRGPQAWFEAGLLALGWQPGRLEPSTWAPAICAQMTPCFPTLWELFSDLRARLEAFSGFKSKLAKASQEHTEAVVALVRKDPGPCVLGLDKFVFQDKINEIQKPHDQLAIF